MEKESHFSPISTHRPPPLLLLLNQAPCCCSALASWLAMLPGAAVKTLLARLHNHSPSNSMRPTPLVCGRPFSWHTSPPRTHLHWFGLHLFPWQVHRAGSAPIILSPSEDRHIESMCGSKRHDLKAAMADHDVLLDACGIARRHSMRFACCRNAFKSVVA